MNEKLTLKLQHKEHYLHLSLKRLYRGAPVYFLLAEYEDKLFGNYDKSLEYFSRAKQYYQILGDSFHVSKTQHAISKKYIKTGLMETWSDKTQAEIPMNFKDMKVPVYI